jgi:putative photosynthetic complex assembly protein
MGTPLTSRDTVPRMPLIGAGIMLAVIFAAVVVVSQSGMVIRAPDAAAVVVRELRFEDRSDGSIAVFDGKTGAKVDAVTGQAGFIRGTLRGLARERRARGLGPEQPFQLIGRADGRLTLSDPATGRTVDLESFGPVNAGVFAQMLDTHSAR